MKLAGGDSVQARAIIIATGARYRRLDVEGHERFEGQGLHYAATAMEASLCGGEEVIVVGGGNSAGQAAVYLSRVTAHVHVLVRTASLAATMSDYLVQRILKSDRITLQTHTKITALAGDERLREVTWRNQASGVSTTKPIGNVFLMIGAEPNTDWLQGCLDLDEKGFVKTGYDPEGDPLKSPYATTRPGIFAVGDVRSGSVKRVASAVGEGLGRNTGRPRHAAHGASLSGANLPLFPARPVNQRASQSIRMLSFAAPRGNLGSCRPYSRPEEAYRRGGGKNRSPGGACRPPLRRAPRPCSTGCKGPRSCHAVQGRDHARARGDHGGG